VQMIWPITGRGRPRKRPILLQKSVDGFGEQ
jgi:hypothetical protein